MPAARCGHRTSGMAVPIRLDGGPGLGVARGSRTVRCRVDRRWRWGSDGRRRFPGGRTLPRHRMPASEVDRGDRPGSASHGDGRIRRSIRRVAGNAEEPGCHRGERGKRGDRADGPDACAAPFRRRIDREVGKLHEDRPGSAVRAMPYGKSRANRCSAASISPHSWTRRSIRASSAGSVVETA